MVSVYDLGESIAPIGTVSQSPIVCLGRICVASETGDGKVNAKSILLEGSRDDAVASFTVGRIQLDLFDLPGYSLFPGQMVAVKGICSRPDRMIVQAIYHGVPMAPLAAPAANMRAVASLAEKRASGPLRVWAAAGPFSLHANLDYTPLHDFFEEAKGSDIIPDVILLVRELWGCGC
jgi:DNA polymerase alpha subunit B